MKGVFLVFVALCVLYVVDVTADEDYDSGNFGIVRYSTEETDSYSRTPIYATAGVTYPARPYKGRFDELRKTLQEENSQFHNIIKRDIPPAIFGNAPSFPEGIIDPEQRVIYSDGGAVPENNENSEDVFPHQNVIVGVDRPVSTEVKVSQKDPKDEVQEILPPAWLMYNNPSAVKSAETAAYSNDEDEHPQDRSNRGRALHFTTSLNIPSFPNGINAPLPSFPKLPPGSPIPTFSGFPGLPSLPGVPSISSPDDIRKRGRDFIDSIVRNRRIILHGGKPNAPNDPPTGVSKCVHKLSLTGDDFVIDGHIYFSEDCQQPGENGRDVPTADNAWRPNLLGFNGSPGFAGVNRPLGFLGGVPGFPASGFPGVPEYPGIRHIPGIKGLTPLRPGLSGFGHGLGVGGFPLGQGRFGYDRSLSGEEDTHGTEVPTEECDDNVTSTTAANEEPNTQNETSSNKPQDEQEKKTRETSIKIGPLKFGFGFGDRT